MYVCVLRNYLRIETVRLLICLRIISMRHYIHMLLYDFLLTVIVWSLSLLLLLLVSTLLLVGLLLVLGVLGLGFRPGVTSSTSDRYPGDRMAKEIRQKFRQKHFAPSASMKGQK